MGKHRQASRLENHLDRLDSRHAPAGDKGLLPSPDEPVERLLHGSADSGPDQGVGDVGTSDRTVRSYAVNQLFRQMDSELPELFQNAETPLKPVAATALEA